MGQGGNKKPHKYGRIIPCGFLLVLFLFLLFNAIFFDIFKNVSFSRAYFDRNGGLLNIFLTADDKYRLRTSLSDFPVELMEAALLQEDRYFYGHLGINPMSMFRAGWETYIKKGRRVGASTITMQTARLRYGIYTKNFGGKIIQSIAAVFLEICLSKQEILEAYLNLVPCGGNIEGFPAAAWFYFGKDVKELSLTEILSLAVIPQNPVKRAPVGGRVSDEFVNARKTLYAAWVKEHPKDILMEAEMDMPPYLVNSFPRRLLHFTEYLNARSLPRDMRHRTTIDSSLQNICERELGSYLVRNRNWGVYNGSILLIDYTSMEVLAAIGSADYFSDEIQGQVNGFASKRSPGSTLKPFIYALAIEQGIIHPEKMLKDTFVAFNEYMPDNFDGTFRGPVAAWYALTDSRNIPAIQLSREIRSPDLYDFLANADISGLKGKGHYGLSIVLGSADVTMLELSGLYAALCNDGIKKDIRFLTGTNDSRQGKKILTPAAATITLKMLERNPAPDDVREGAARSVPVAYKTGTSIGFKDAWSVAVFDRYVLCVWIGNFSGEGNSVFVGRRSAAPLSFNIIDAILAQMPDAKLLPRKPLPPDVKEVKVCAVSGDISNEDCPLLSETLFIPGVSPINVCRIHRRIFIDTRTGYRTDDTEGAHVRSEVREFWSSDIMEIFSQAGLPRFSPPPYPPDFNVRAYKGFPPSILSPLANTVYVIRPSMASDGRFNQMVLIASADQDTRELFWFANTQFLGRARPGERFVWVPGPGAWNLSVIDGNGRSAGIRVNVEVALE